MVGLGGRGSHGSWAAALRWEGGFHGALQGREVKSLEPLPVQQRKPIQKELQMQIVAAEL